ncbi:predicted protein [Sparassis crispa]|uniref:Tetraspanin Tsp2 n=1 Tax=Sparassis crispa TaxID=139825 RepID=A0A401GSK5_9APHY|nr:predicted protein [Sparassis crispa]GBE85149.1 predicted protein [Sparassis crispa]
MDRRFPSSSSALARDSFIRHRSGAYSPNPDGLTPHYRPRRDSLLHEGTLTVQVEDADDLRGEPTILLVRPSRVSPPLPNLPPLQGISNGSPLLAASDFSLDPHRSYGSGFPPRAQAAGDEVCDSPVAFSPVPLTPRPAAPPRNESTRTTDTTQTSVSQISRLPTPDFTSRTSGGVIRSFLPRLFSVRGVQSASTGAPADVRPRNHRNATTLSDVSEGSTAVSTCSGDSSLSTTTLLKRPALLPSLSTTDRFTQKFPRPRSIRNPTFEGGRSGHKSAFAATMLEEGEGLGIDRVDRWPTHKWCLVLSVSTVFVYGLAGLVCAIVTWWRTWEMANVMYVADNDILILITLASSILLLTFLVGISGTILNSRPILAIYALLLWPAFISMLVIGYTSYKRWAFSLDRKLNLAWSQWYTPLGRLIIQDTLRCCGYYSALHEATPSKRCYPRTPLPGCKGKLYRFERENLGLIWSTTFALVPIHVLNIVVALLCANHVTRTFGKGIMPKQYRLSGEDVRADAERIMGALGSVRPVIRPEVTRLSSSGVFREDREDYFPSSDDEWERLHIMRSDSIGLGISHPSMRM